MDGEFNGNLLDIKDGPKGTALGWLDGTVVGDLVDDNEGMPVRFNVGGSER